MVIQTIPVINPVFYMSWMLIGKTTWIEPPPDSQDLPIPRAGSAWFDPRPIGVFLIRNFNWNLYRGGSEPNKNCWSPSCSAWYRELVFSCTYCQLSTFDSCCNGLFSELVPLNLQSRCLVCSVNQTAIVPTWLPIWPSYFPAPEVGRSVELWEGFPLSRLF